MTAETVLLDENASTFTTILAILSYSICSSTLLLANKYVTLHISSTIVISLIQLTFTSFTLILMKTFQIDTIDDFEWKKVKGYLLLTLSFFSSLFTNIKALSTSNVETVIVFRSCSPIAVCLIEYCFLNREFPSFRSSCSLIGVVIGAILYCLNDSNFLLKGWSSYGWVVAYFCMVSIDMTYGKVLSQSVKMDSIWGSVYYCNLLTIVPFVCMGIYEGDFIEKVMVIRELSWFVMGILLFSCIVGTFIGYTGWLCRNILSATTYSLVGVINKFFTIFLNVAIWDKHSTPMGILAVCLCLGCGLFYEQAPRRAVKEESLDEQLELVPMIATAEKPPEEEEEHEEVVSGNEQVVSTVFGKKR